MSSQRRLPVEPRPICLSRRGAAGCQKQNLLRLLAAAGGMWVASFVLATETNPGSGYHVVRPGETLRDLAARFLGNPELWPELQKLNPQLRDSNRIYPGQRLRVVLRQQGEPSYAAQLLQTERRVEDRPTPVPWLAASPGDLLFEQDGLRTFGKSSARLQFRDGSELTLIEDSLVFLRQEGSEKTASTKREIEVLVGQAELKATGSQRRRAGPSSVEVILGDARVSSEGGAEAGLHSRARIDQSRKAQLMAYRGGAELLAAGQKVQLPEGTGSTVLPAQPPSPPEPLLPAPHLSRPADGEAVERSGIQLAWEKVPGAASYLLELCRDPTCGAIFERKELGSDQLAVAVEDPGLGEFYWRVTARSPSGLDGYPSAERRIALVEALPLPTPELRLVDRDGQPLTGECFAVPPQVAMVRPPIEREGLQWSLLVNGSSETPEQFLSRSGQVGSFLLSVRVQDARGRTAASEPIQITLDPVAPWVELSGGSSGPTQQQLARWARDSEKKRARVLSPLRCGEIQMVWVGPDGAAQALPCGSAEPLRIPVSGTEARGRLRIERPAMSVGERIFAQPGEELELVLRDLGCGLALFELWLAPKEASVALFARIEDRAGHERVLRWDLASPPRR